MRRYPSISASLFQLATAAAGGGHDIAGNDLTAALDRMSDPRHGARFHQPAAQAPAARSER
jgi:hypothetical protein